VSGLLVVFAGLPGTGKTTIARQVADRLASTLLRVDSIETAVARAGMAVDDSPVGYAVAHAVAADQLVSGRPVVVDAVNSVGAARAGWLHLAGECGAWLRFVRVVLPDADEHRRRVESRVADLPGHVLPTWHDIATMREDEWIEPHLELDSRSRPDETTASVLAWLGAG
jgi:predicted kinase